MIGKSSNAMRYTVEIFKHFNDTPPCFYVYNEGGPERKVNIFCKISCITLLLQYSIDEVLLARTAADLSYHYLVEQVQSIGFMRKSLSENMEKIICNANSNNKIWELCEENSKLGTELKNSLDQSERLMEVVHNFGDYLGGKLALWFYKIKIYKVSSILIKALC